MKALNYLKDKWRFFIAFVVRCFWRLIAKVYFYYTDNIGIKLNFKRTFGNGGQSKHTWLLLSRHPRRSITWIWAIYYTKPEKWHRIIRSIYILRQDPMWR